MPFLAAASLAFVTIRLVTMIANSGLRFRISFGLCPSDFAASMLKPTEFPLLGQVEQPQNPHINREEIDFGKVPKRPCSEVAEHLGHRMRGETSGEYCANYRFAQRAKAHDRRHHDDCQ